MMEFKRLISEIPSGTYHSVLMTSFSINLFYLDTQLARALSAKGINYVSAVIDARCLSEQLEKFSFAFSNDKRIEYSLHGYIMNGSFHPKIQFYVGNKHILALVGSGNITISGHGGNMEGWSVISADSAESPSYKILMDIWDYLQYIYRQLGDEGMNFIRTVEENCKLLVEGVEGKVMEYDIDGSYSVRFFSNKDRNIYEKLIEWIGNDPISQITVMSPFYDRNGQLLQNLIKQYSPGRINLILEDGFGSLPYKKSLPENVHIYKWDSVERLDTKKKHDYFHAKCFFFKGERYNYVIVGSANASYAAFGGEKAQAINEEACIGYKSSEIDYLAECGLSLTEEASFDDISPASEFDSEGKKEKITVWIKEASYEYDNYSLHLHSEVSIDDARIIFYNSSKQILNIKNGTMNLKKGDLYVRGSFENESVPLYVEINDANGSLISNRQFVISRKSMIINNPSKENREYRRRCHDIEEGGFLNQTTFLFFEKLMTNSVSKSKTTKSETEKNSKNNEETGGKIYADFTRFQADDGESITGYNLKKPNKEHMKYLYDQLPASIIRYITNSHKSVENQTMDNEESDDVRTSEGNGNSHTKELTDNEFERIETLPERIKMMYVKYMDSIPPHETNKKGKDSGRRESLKKFLAAEYFLNRIIGYRYVRKDEAEETSLEHALMEIPYSNSKDITATKYIYRIMSQFSVHLMNMCEEVIGDPYEVRKFKEENRDALDLSIALISVCDWINEGNAEYTVFAEQYKVTTLKNIEYILEVDIKDVSATDIYKMIESSIMSLPGFDKGKMYGIISNNLSLMKANDETISFQTKLGYYKIVRFNDLAGVPSSLAFPYKIKHRLHCPDYMYSYPREKCLPIKPTPTF